MTIVSLAIRCLATWGFLLLLLRLAGKRTVRQGSTFDFVFALVVGDLVDNAIWAEVPFMQFVVAAGTLIGAKLMLTAHQAVAALEK